MKDVAAYLITSQVAEIAASLWRHSVSGMTEEEFASAPPMSSFFPQAVEVFMSEHAEIQRLVAQYEQENS